MNNSYYSNGKLLITAEYVVLDGAKALALPTKYGQSLKVIPIKETQLIWESYTFNDELWLQVVFDLPRLRIINATFDAKNDGGEDNIAENLQNMLQEAKKMDPRFLSNQQGFYVKSKLTFQRNWGLGSSSTLINNIAQWANINAFNLQFNTFGGSAYDIACAQNNGAILYTLNDKEPIVEKIDFNPSFKDQLFFIHLNKKQNSRDAIAGYRNFKGDTSALTREISELTMLVTKCLDLTDFEKILQQHEKLISSVIQENPIQQSLFSDYFGQTKSLGAWGGDFILATGNEDSQNYFKNKGFNTVIPFQDMILCGKK